MSEHRDTLSVGVGNSLCRANVMERSCHCMIQTPDRLLLLNPI